MSGFALIPVAQRKKKPVSGLPGLNSASAVFSQITPFHRNHPHLSPSSLTIFRMTVYVTLQGLMRHDMTLENGLRIAC